MSSCRVPRPAPVVVPFLMLRAPPGAAEHQPRWMARERSDRRATLQLYEVVRALLDLRFLRVERDGTLSVHAVSTNPQRSQARVLNTARTLPPNLDVNIGPCTAASVRAPD
jgi:hypothetical protein